MNEIGESYRVNLPIDGDRVDVADLEKKFGGLLNAIRQLNMPCWVREDRESFRITRENHEAVILGVMLGLAVSARWHTKKHTKKV